MGSVSAWRRQAACQGEDPALFDPDHPNLWQDGIGVCRRCPVQLACLAEHQGNPGAHGVYGGIPLEHGQPVDVAARLRQHHRHKRATLLAITQERWGSVDDLLRELA